MYQIYRSKGLGPSTLIQGDQVSGYYGKVNGIITAADLISTMGINVGTATISGDITWLKFSHNYKTIFVADRCILTNISWDQLNSFRAIFGKVITKGTATYLARSMQGSHQNPSPNIITDNPTDIGLIGPNSEWYNTIAKFTPDNADSNWSGIWTMCQEIHSSLISQRLFCGERTVLSCDHDYSNMGKPSYGWRPVLEVLNPPASLYLIKQSSKYYSTKSGYYDSLLHQFNELNLSGGTTPNLTDINMYAFPDLSQITQLLTVDQDSFRPIDKFGNSFEIKKYLIP